MLEVSKEDLETVKRLLARHVTGCEVRVFGSRAGGKPKSYSDLDLALVGPGKIDSGCLTRLKEDFQNSDLPFRVDIVDWALLDESFRRVILKSYEVLTL